MADSVINPLLDGGYLPHPVIRVGIRRQLSQRLHEIATQSQTEAYESKMKYVELLRRLSSIANTNPIACVDTEKETAPLPLRRKRQTSSTTKWEPAC